MALTQIRGEQIHDLNIRDNHIAADAAIVESKLDLNFPTHAIDDTTVLQNRKVADYIQVVDQTVSGLSFDLTTPGIIPFATTAIAAADNTTEGVFDEAHVNSKVIIRLNATGEPILGPLDREVYGRTFKDATEWVLKFYTTDGTTETAYDFTVAQDIDFQYLQRFNMFTVSELFAANEKFVYGAADSTAYLNIAQIVADTFTAGYTLDRDGNGNLVTPLQTLITEHIAALADAHDAEAISFVNTTAALPGAPADVQAAIEAIVTFVGTEFTDLLADLAATTGGGLIGFDNTLSALTPLAGQGASVDTVQEAIDALKDYVDNAAGGAASYSNTAAAIVHIDGVTAVATAQDAIDGLDKVLDAMTVEMTAVEASIGTAVDTAGVWVGFTGTDAVDAATSITNAIELLDTALQAHLDDAVGAHAGSAISFNPTGTNFDPTTITVQAALAEIDADLALHIGETVEAHMASAVGYSKAGWTAIDSVSEALDDLQDRLVIAEGAIAATHQHYYHEEVATAAQTAVTLTPVYTVGDNSLKVFVNGSLQMVGALNAYVETDSSTVTFNSGLSVGDVIQIEWSN